MREDDNIETRELEANQVPVGGPLYLAEARFLAQALKEKHIKYRILRDTSLGESREAIHTVVVRPQDLDSALGIRDEVLGTDEDRENEKNEEAAGRKGILWKAITAGFLGVVVGFRVGIKFRYGPWPVLFPPLLGIISFLAVLMLWPEYHDETHGPGK